MKLKALHAREIGMTTIGTKFIWLPKLETLILSENEIRRLTRKNFVDLTTLRELHLDDNKVRKALVTSFKNPQFRLITSKTKPFTRW